jgi:hypothetical protein
MVDPFDTVEPKPFPVASLQTSADDMYVESVLWASNAAQGQQYRQKARCVL